MDIRVLDRHTVNQIAAGEVIERPSSALKELLENSADSGASRIEIDFDGGGKTELRVTDDGRGMSPDDLPLALEPHATSKIEKIDDLMTLRTFGFRGEALASMAAVSDLTIHSGQKNAETGAKILARAGNAEEVVPAPPIRGTQVTVRNLFHNVPARQKFLKSEAGETAAIKKVIKGFALSHPEISITARQSGKVLFHWEKESLAQRACRVLELKGDQVIHLRIPDQDLPLENNSMKLEAVLALPEHHLPTQSAIWIFVQGRPVTDRSLQHAILEGYRNLLMQHQYPRAVISIWVDPSQVDVNVHPTKAQVKFADAGALFRFVSRSLKEGLEKKYGENIAPAVSQSGGEYQSGNFGSDQISLMAQEFATQYNQRIFQNQGAGQTSPPVSEQPRAGLSDPVNRSRQENGVAGIYGPWSSLHVIGQAANTYILCQSPKALILIDQHAAHERVLFERIKRQAKEKGAEKQGALLEELITLSRESIEALTESRFGKIFEELGFEFIDRGPTTLAVAARPAFLLEVGLQPLLERVAEQIGEIGASTAVEDVITDIWATMSCHGAIRAGRTLSPDEMKSLLFQMDEFAFSSFCPHGRPVSVQWTLRDLEKLFKRIV